MSVAAAPGLDIGGTFTDAVAIAPDGRASSAKALSKPGNLSAGVLDAVSGARARPERDERVRARNDGGLNAFLERRGARVALLTTLGFRDVYEIGRANRPAMYDVRYRPPRPLVARRDVYEVHERMSPEGQTLQPVNETKVPAHVGTARNRTLDDSEGGDGRWPDAERTR